MAGAPATGAIGVGVGGTAVGEGSRVGGAAVAAGVAVAGIGVAVGAGAGLGAAVGALVAVGSVEIIIAWTLRWIVNADSAAQPIMPNATRGMANNAPNPIYQIALAACARRDTCSGGAAGGGGGAASTRRTGALGGAAALCANKAWSRSCSDACLYVRHQRGENLARRARQEPSRVSHRDPGGGEPRNNS